MQTASVHSKFLHDILLASLVGFLLWLYYPTLGLYALRDWDESIYAQVAKESVHPFAFTWLGGGSADQDRWWFEKPPLVIWLVQGSFALFGVTEFASRIFTPLFGGGVLLLSYAWARHLAGRTAGLVAAGSFFVCYHFLLQLGTLNYDVPVAFFMCAALYAYSRTAESSKYWYIFGVVLGLGVMVKSVVGLLPLLIVMFDVALRKGRGIQMPRGLFVALLIALCVVLPWHIIETVQFGSAFWQNYLLHQVVARFASGIESNGGPWQYYFTIFKQLPYAYLALPALCYGLYKTLQRNQGLYIPTVSFLVIFVAFTLARTKGSGYIVPVYPYLAVLIGVGGSKLLEATLKSVWLRAAATSILLLTFVLSGAAYNRYRLIKMRSPVYENIKEIAGWISVHENAAELHYIAYADVQGIASARPLLVFYTGRYVYASGQEEAPLGPSVYRTPTHQVFVKGNDVYIVAVRFIP